MNVWVSALRPKTLGASLCPVLMGGALAWRDGVFAWTPVLAAFSGACLLQIASNFANDLFDGRRGTDSGVGVHARLGPPRAVGSGAVSQRAMAMALVLALVLAVIPASYLTVHAGAIFAVIGVLGAICAVLYTAGPAPLGYIGLGDFFVFAFFGPIAVAGTRAACDGAWTSAAFASGIAPGAIAVALLATNNLRDRIGDAAHGKRTLVVRLGEGFGRAQIVACHALAILVPLVAILFFGVPRGALTASMLAILLAPISMSIILGRDGAALNKSLAGFGAMLYFYGVAFAVGVYLGGVAA
ncbi:MAG: 1,4-dihydroxy-2-naphthoate octaprenyltransferase [Planctomycetota bacterium]